MKINEFKQIEEGIVSGIKGLISGQGSYQTKVQDIFIKDFVQDALTSLNNGIKGGLIDINVKSASNNSSVSTAPATASSPTAPSSAAVPTTSSTQVPPAQQTGQAMNNQQTATAKMQTRAGIQPTGQKMTPAQRTQAQLQARKMQAARKPVPVKESSYDKMSRVFESIITVEDNTGMSISQYMYNWFSQYMQGVDWQGSKNSVEQKLRQLQDQYPQHISQNLKDLARIGLALSKASSPAGAPQEFRKQFSQKNTDVTPEEFVELYKAMSPQDKVKAANLIRQARP